jgi:iron complex outermembrane receptor protein
MKSTLKHFSARPISYQVGRTARCIATTALFGAAPAFSALLEEVVVTAQKREQNLQDVGISVTAFSADQMRQLGFTNSIDVIAHTPNVEVTGAGGGVINTFSIRGVTQNDFSAAQESPIAVYVDDVYISQNFVTGFSLFDLERVEVLRGPQGTLFGRNATGGLVHYLSARPSDETEGFVDLTVGDKGRERVEAAVGGALTDTVSGRLSGVYNKNDGLIENRIGSDVMQTDDYALRGQLLFQPTESLDVLFKGLYVNEDSARGGYAHAVGFDGAFSNDPRAVDFFGYQNGGDPFKGDYDFDGFKELEMTAFTLSVDWDLGAFTFVSITNIQDIENEYGEDSDASPSDIYNYEAKDEVDQFSQEFRVSWEGENSRSVVGLYYLDLEGDYATYQSGEVFFGPGFVYGLAGEQETETIALFGQTEIDLSDKLSLTLGVRFNRDEKGFAFSELGAQLYSDDFSDDDWSAKVQLDYRPNEDWLWYVGVNRGIKSGGFNMPLGPPADFTTFPYEGEVLYSYEGGFKSALGDTTRLNASIFYYDYEDYQAYTFDGFVPLLFNANAENYGVEIELITNPIDGLEIMLGAGWVDTEVQDVPLSISASGKEDGVLAPELSLSGLVRYSWDALGGTIAIQSDYSWKDDHKFNLAVTPVIEEDSYGLLNALVSYTSGNEAWYVSIFAKNLTDEDYRSYAFDTTTFFGATEDVPGPERWVGANLRFSW